MHGVGSGAKARIPHATVAYLSVWTGIGIYSAKPELPTRRKLSLHEFCGYMAVLKATFRSTRSE